jgi:hypothetical protein
MTDFEERLYLNLFSVPAASMPTVKNRAIVRFEGSSTGGGIWVCSKDAKASMCTHIGSARQLLWRLFPSSEGGEDENDTGDDRLQFDSEYYQFESLG